MNYRQIKPSSSVARYVEFYWTLEDTPTASYIHRIVPDGRACMVINFANPFQSFAKGKWQLQPPCFAIGQITGPILLRPSGRSRLLGVQFRPEGVTQLLRLPMCELTNSAIALDDFSLGWLRQIEQVREIPSLTQAIAEIDRILYRRAAQTATENDLISYAISEIERTAGSADIKGIANAMGCSTRQLQRRFKNTVGISPKLFGRMQRFQGVLRAMTNSTLDWVSIAIDCGYYDQAHLIRDFREFSGKTPSSLLDHEIDLTQRFVQGAGCRIFPRLGSAQFAIGRV
jgi:AraC-like DNA-binding protein